MSEVDSKIDKLRVELMGTKPPSWRRIEVLGGTLEDLHYDIQAAMGWTNSHMHAFEVNSQYSI